MGTFELIKTISTYLIPYTFYPQQHKSSKMMLFSILIILISFALLSNAQYSYDLRSATLSRRNPNDQHYELNNIQTDTSYDFNLKCYHVLRASELENRERRWLRRYERRKKARLVKQLPPKYLVTDQIVKNNEEEVQLMTLDSRQRQVYVPFHYDNIRLTKK